MEEVRRRGEVRTLQVEVVFKAEQAETWKRRFSCLSSHSRNFEERRRFLVLTGDTNGSLKRKDVFRA